MDCDDMTEDQIMNLWITVKPADDESAIRYFATGDATCFALGSFGRSLRALTKVLLTHQQEVTRLVFSSASELRAWSRVQNPAYSDDHKKLLRLVEKRDIAMVLAPGRGELGIWNPEKVGLPVVKKKQGRIVWYTDGSVLWNPDGPGGWSAVTDDPRVPAACRELSGTDINTTNNVMEMSPILAVLNAVYQTLGHGAEVQIISDSRYALNGSTEWKRGWKARDYAGVKNGELWRAIHRAQALVPDVEYSWVKGHSGIPGNERADALAGKMSSRALVLRRKAGLNCVKPVYVRRNGKATERQQNDRKSSGTHQ
jgi:ribonuclease HI